MSNNGKIMFKTSDVSRIFLDWNITYDVLKNAAKNRIFYFDSQLISFWQDSNLRILERAPGIFYLHSFKFPEGTDIERVKATGPLYEIPKNTLMCAILVPPINELDVIIYDYYSYSRTQNTVSVVVLGYHQQLKDFVNGVPDYDFEFFEKAFFPEYTINFPLPADHDIARMMVEEGRIFKFGEIIREG